MKNFLLVPILFLISPTIFGQRMPIDELISLSTKNDADIVAIVIKKNFELLSAAPYDSSTYSYTTSYIQSPRALNRRLGTRYIRIEKCDGNATNLYYGTIEKSEYLLCLKYAKDKQLVQQSNSLIPDVQKNSISLKYKFPNKKIYITFTQEIHKEIEDKIIYGIKISEQTNYNPFK